MCLVSWKCVWILVGSVLDSGTCFWILGRVLDSRKCFGFWDVFLDSRKCFVPTSHLTYKDIESNKILTYVRKREIGADLHRSGASVSSWYTEMPSIYT